MAKSVVTIGDLGPRADDVRASRRFNATSLVSISEAMGGDKSPKEILQLILKSAFSITRATSASLMLIEPESGTLRVEAAEGFKGRNIFSTRLRVGQGVTGWVAETGVPLRIGNVRNDPRYVRVQSDLRSELAVPLKIGGRVIGVISVDSTRVNHFTSEDEALLLSLAAQSARVIQTTRLYEEARRRAAELELLNEITGALSSTLDLRQVLAQAVEQTARVCRAEIVSIFLIQEGGVHLDMAASFGGSEDYRRQPPVILKQSFLAPIIEGGKAAVIAEVDPQTHGAALALDATVKSLLVVPLLAKGKALGVLCAFGGRGRSFDVHDQRLLENIARSAAMAIENARAHRRMLGAEEALRSGEKFSMVGELAAGLAHEIRNPLTSMKVLLGTLLKNSQFGSDGRQDAEMIEKQMLRLEKIVDGFLGTARSLAHAAEMKTVDLNAIVDEAMLLLATASNEGTRLNVDLSDGELAVRGDATQLSQVVYNLVLNAIQAVERRGRINVATRRHAGEGQPPRVCFEVSDDGPGLQPAVRDRLFQPFVTTKKSGVGLGLSIVKRIVEAHGGELEVESPRADIGRGASFRVWLGATGEPAKA